MLMIDREDGQPSHTMWVVKPIAPARYEHDSSPVTIEADDLAPEPASSIDPTFGDRSHHEQATPFPFNYPIMVDPILCRICECQIPQWYFKKHSETCAETHRLEAEILECNESIAELRNTIRDLSAAVDRSSPVAIPEYRGMPIFSPAASPSLSLPLQLFRATVPREQNAEIWREEDAEAIVRPVGGYPSSHVGGICSVSERRGS